MADANIQGADLEKEKLQEAELLKETPTDEVRNSIIEKYGLDEDASGELIDKLVAGEIESGKKLSTAIKQKIAWRERASKPAEKPPVEQKPAEKPQPVPADDVKKIVREELEERDLSSLEVSEELKKELKTYAKAGGLTLKQAMASDYYKFLKQSEESKARAEDASIGGKRRSPSKREFSAVTPPKPDMSTPEGRQEWADYLKFLKTS